MKWHLRFNNDDNNIIDLGPRGLVCETYLQEVMGWESFDVVRFGLWPSFKVRRGLPNLKVLITHLLSYY